MPWRLPWTREKRESGGDFSDAVVRELESRAAGIAADAGATAAVEAAAGALSRAFAGATVEADDWARAAVSRAFLAQVGRDLIRSGASLHVIRAGGAMVRLIPVSSWHWEGGYDPAGWTVRATAYGPSTSTTWNLPAASVVFARWGSTPGTPYVGTAPTRWAKLTARLNAEAERSLADEAGGPLAQFIPYPADGGDDDDENDPLRMLKRDIAAARGKAMLVETTAAGLGDGPGAAPRRDWQPQRLGPSPPAALVEVRRDAFDAVLAATGTPPSLFRGDEDGTAQREAVRRWHLGTVIPLARLLEEELSAKLATPVRLRFDPYPLDLQVRAQAFERFTRAGLKPKRALREVGLMGLNDGG